MSKAIFLDRDGVINKDTHYVNCVEDFHIFPKVKDAILLLKQAGYKIFVVTNQGGIEKGFLTHEDLDKIHGCLLGEIPEINDIRYADNYYDFNRKPNPGMIYDLAYMHKINIGESWMVGDRFTDIQAGLNAGCRTALVVNNLQESFKAHDKAHIFGDSLYEVAIQILKRDGFLL